MTKKTMTGEGEQRLPQGPGGCGRSLCHAHLSDGLRAIEVETAGQADGQPNRAGAILYHSSDAVGLKEIPRYVYHCNPTWFKGEILDGAAIKAHSEKGKRSFDHPCAPGILLPLWMFKVWSIISPLHEPRHGLHRSINWVRKMAEEEKWSTGLSDAVMAAIQNVPIKNRTLVNTIYELLSNRMISDESVTAACISINILIRRHHQHPSAYVANPYVGTQCLGGREAKAVSDIFKLHKKQADIPNASLSPGTSNPMTAGLDTGLQSFWTWNTQHS
ncbi:uncharacterized protein BXZ73DRAFT_74784 [Epithele typhae]|uniref:uncharacterized protein n=1 Tax=Epithele typhae TaxID=378194 RepID=UPI0020088E35|nr:uncharacterized protein BXZ73DRAFT_74784 [Epithele typhae]KAH9942542.1 hypothetical protein BXZ73DRAFT_74784 [Epithele typhae]